jgi:hypothetical protein
MITSMDILQIAGPVDGSRLTAALIDGDLDISGLSSPISSPLLETYTTG